MEGAAADSGSQARVWRDGCWSGLFLESLESLGKMVWSWGRSGMVGVGQHIYCLAVWGREDRGGGCLVCSSAAPLMRTGMRPVTKAVKRKTWRAGPGDGLGGLGHAPTPASDDDKHAHTPTTPCPPRPLPLPPCTAAGLAVAGSSRSGDITTPGVRGLARARAARPVRGSTVSSVAGKQTRRHRLWLRSVGASQPGMTGTSHAQSRLALRPWSRPVLLTAHDPADA